MFNTEDTYAYFEGKIVPFKEAKVSVMNHAFNYGTAVFGGVRANWNEEEQQAYLFRPADHFKRLADSSRLMFMTFHERYTAEEFTKICAELIKKSNLKEDVYFRPVVYKSTEIVGVRLHNLDDELTIYMIPLNDYVPLTGLRCGFSSWRRTSDNAIPARGKINGSYVNSAFSKTEAVKNGFDEAIVTDQEGHVVEGSAENLFIIRDGVAYTPSPSSDILEGITRKTLMQLLRDDLGVQVIERNIGRTELFYADEVFLCGTGAKVAPVVEIDHRMIGNGKAGPISQKLQTLYFDVVKGNVAKYKSWLAPIF